MEYDDDLYLFDYDGTLSLPDHRRHFISNGNKQWDEFFLNAKYDPPNEPVVKLFNSLVLRSTEVRIFSGRSEAVRKDAEEWLLKNTALCNIYPDTLTMRPEGDFTPDHELKAYWYHNVLTPADRRRLVLVVDDRQKVVNMWRTLGVTCLQCAPGGF